MKPALILYPLAFLLNIFAAQLSPTVSIWTLLLSQFGGIAMVYALHWSDIFRRPVDA